jgi:type II secretory pathway component GspD/PulD (secretin)
MNRVSFATFATAVFMLVFFEEVIYGQETKPQPFVPIRLVQFDALRAAKKLASVFGSEVKIVVDKESNTVFLQGNADKIKLAKEILLRLDEPQCSYVVSLKKTNAVETTKTLKAVLFLFTLLGDDRDVFVSANEKGNSIIIRASEDKAKQIIEMIHWLDGKTSASVLL